MPLNHYVTLGRSGLRVSPLCLGAMTFGMEWNWGSTPEDSHAILDAFAAAGGNFIDTANIYTRGHSEAILGDYMAARMNRDRLVVATKFFGNLYRNDPNGGGASRKTIHESLAQSLRRLKTDYVDLYLLHAWDRFTPIEETMRALDDLVKAGSVRYVGFSDTPAWKLAQAQTLATLRAWSPLVALQIEYSLLERTVEGELIPAAIELGCGVTPWSPLAGGALTGKYSRQGGVEGAGRGQWVAGRLNERAFAIVDILKTAASESRCSVSQAAISWVQNRPGVASTIIGARTMDQLKDNLGALDVSLSPEQTRRLDEASKPSLNFPHDFLERGGPFMQGGATVNGRPSEIWPLSPANDQERW